MIEQAKGEDDPHDHAAVFASPEHVSDGSPPLELKNEGSDADVVRVEISSQSEDLKGRSSQNQYPALVQSSIEQQKQSGFSGMTLSQGHFGPTRGGHDSDDGDEDGDEDDEEEDYLGWKDDERDGDFVDPNSLKKPARKVYGRFSGLVAPPLPLAADLSGSFQMSNQVPMPPVMVDKGNLLAQVHEEKEASAALDELFRAASDDFQDLRPDGSHGSSVIMAAGLLKRSDLPPVCDRCRRLHRKCDRQMPCSECRMRNSNCTTGGSRRATQGGRGSTKGRKPGPKPGFRKTPAPGALGEPTGEGRSAAEPEALGLGLGGGFGLASASVGQALSVDFQQPAAAKRSRLDETTPPPMPALIRRGMVVSAATSKEAPPSLGLVVGRTILPGDATLRAKLPLDPEALLPDSRNRVSLSDATTAFLPAGMGQLDICGPCRAFGRKCDRRNPCSECILRSNELGCKRPPGRRRKVRRGNARDQ